MYVCTMQSSTVQQWEVTVVARRQPASPARQQPARRKLEMGPDYAMHIPQLPTTRNYPTGCTSKSCLNLPAKSIRPPAEPTQESPRRFRIISLLTRTLATRRGKDDTAIFQCLPPLSCGCQVSDDYCTGIAVGVMGAAGRGATFLPTVGQDEPVSELPPGAVGVVDVWLDETF